MLFIHFSLIFISDDWNKIAAKCAGDTEIELVNGTQESIITRVHLEYSLQCSSV